MRPAKERTDPRLEVDDPAGSVGLWSRHAFRTARLEPVGPALRAMGGLLMDDLARWATMDEALERIAAAPGATPARRLAALREQLRGAPPPPWLAAWDRFADWLRPGLRAPLARLGFGSARTGTDCSEENLRRGRTLVLDIGGVLHVAVMLKAGWGSWPALEKMSAAPARLCRRLVLPRRGGCLWRPCDLGAVEECVARRELCLFRMEDDPLFRAAADEALNPGERHARLSREFAFFADPAALPPLDPLAAPAPAASPFTLRWALTFNPARAQYRPCDARTPRTLETMQARGRPWAARPVEVASLGEVPAAARRVAETNGCAVVAADAPPALVRALAEALFYVTFPDRPPDAPGGLLRGYMLPGRLLARAPGPLRGDAAAMAAAARVRAAGRRAARRAQVVDALLSRAAAALAARCGLAPAAARARIEAAGGRALLERAAWARGFMEGPALAQFAPGPAAGALKLPDLSLAFAFAHRLGLPLAAPPARLAQAAPVRPLAAALRAARHVVAASAALRPLAFAPGAAPPRPGAPAFFLRDGDRLLLLSFPPAAAYRRTRDLAADAATAVPVSAFRLVPSAPGRARGDMRVEETVLDWAKLVRLARAGRASLHELDFGTARGLAAATWTSANRTPCALVAAWRPVPGRADLLRFVFTANPSAPRPVHREARSWRAYRAAYPGEAAHPVVRWPRDRSATLPDLSAAARACIKKDALLLCATKATFFPARRHGRTRVQKVFEAFPALKPYA